MQTKETIYETYSKELCVNCINKDKDLCHITKTIDNSVKCISYLRNSKSEFNIPKIYTTAKKCKPIMRGISQ